MSTTKQIGGISKTSLTNSAHLNMNTELYERIVAATPAVLKIEKQAPLYREALDTEGLCVNRITKSAATQPMVEKDAERDAVFSFINSQVNSFMTCPDKATKQAAAELEALMSAYADTPWKSFSEETAFIDGLLRDMEGEAVKAAAETLNLTAYFTRLKTLNDEYKAMDAGRTDEYASRVKIDTLSARKVVDDIWAEIAQRVNAVAVLEPSDTVDTFIDTVNQIFRKYKDLIAAKGGSSSTTTPEDAPVPTPDSDAPVIDDGTTDEGSGDDVPELM